VAVIALPALTALIVLPWLGCATTNVSASTPVAPSEVATDYYPLLPNWGWAYEIEREGTKVLALYSVIQRSGETAVIKNADSRIVYAILADGIARQEGSLRGDYVLKNPVRTGTAWPVADGEARIVATGETIALSSGSYRNCAVVEETRQLPDRVNRTTYCMGVGPVTIETRIFDPREKSFQVTARANLLSITRPEDVTPAK
jgi:hypothetical protein